MADVGSRNSFILKELLLKWENTEKPAQSAAHRFYPALAPRPRLRRHQINHRDALGVKPPRHAQVEIRGIGEDGHVRTPLTRDGSQFAVFAPDPRDVGDYLEESHHREASGVNDSLDTSRPQ